MGPGSNGGSGTMPSFGPGLAMTSSAPQQMVMQGSDPMPSLMPPLSPTGQPAGAGHLMVLGEGAEGERSSGLHPTTSGPYEPGSNGGSEVVMTPVNEDREEGYDSTTAGMIGSARSGRSDESDCMYFEVEASRFADPATGEDVVMLVQTDVTQRVRSELEVRAVLDAEHALLETVFPR